MRHEVKQSLRKALSILMIVASLFVFARGRCPIGAVLLVVAFFILGDDDASKKRPRNRPM